MARQPPINVCLAAKNSMKKYRVPASVSLAQWILESGWGAHAPGGNPFGMKCRKGMNDPGQVLMTTEHINGHDIQIPQSFRTFPSVQAAFDAHAELLSTAPVYAGAMAALPDVDLFIDRMAVKYATAPDYAVQLKALIKSQGLSEYDKLSSP